MRTDRLQKEYGVRFEWVVFPLHPETPEDGLDLAAYFAAQGLDIKAVQERLAAVAAKEGLQLQPRRTSSNSRRAQELGKFAEQVGLLDRYMQRVYEAYFVEGVNIAMKEELMKIAGQVGMPEEGARKVLEERTMREAVDNDWRRARKAGINGVPAFLYNSRLLVGFRPYEDLLHLLEQ